MSAHTTRTLRPPHSPTHTTQNNNTNTKQTKQNKAGRFPSQLYSLSNLSWVIVSDNQLTGPLPVDLLHLASACSVVVGFLWCVGVGGVCRRKRGSCSLLLLPANKTTKQPNKQTQIEAAVINLSNNRLSGPIPEPPWAWAPDDAVLTGDASSANPGYWLQGVCAVCCVRVCACRGGGRASVRVGVLRCAPQAPLHTTHTHANTQHNTTQQRSSSSRSSASSARATTS